MFRFLLATVLATGTVGSGNVAFEVLATVPAEVQSKGAPCERLSEEFSIDDPEFLKSAINLTESDLRRIDGCLSHDLHDESFHELLNVLVHTAFPEAVDIIEREVQRRPSLIGKVLYARSIPFSPSEKRLKVLTHSLDGPLIGDEWRLISQAVISLGLLNEDGILSKLWEIRNEGPGTYAGSVATAVIGWITEQEPSLEVQLISKDDEFLRQIIRFEVPELGNLRYFCEVGDTRRTWGRIDGGWHVGAGCDEELKSELRIDSYMSADQKRAIVRARIASGPRFGAHYIYVMRKDGASWSMVSLWRTLVV